MAGLDPAIQSQRTVFAALDGRLKAAHGGVNYAASDRVCASAGTAAARDRFERAEMRAVTMVERYGRLCTPSITIHKVTAGSRKPRSKPMEIMPTSSSASSTASCHTTRSTWPKSAGSAHLGVRRKGLFEVR